MKLSRNILRSAIAAALLGLGGAAQAAILTATDATYGAFDASSGSRLLNIGGVPGNHIKDVNIEITFSKCDDPAMGPLGTVCPRGGFSFNREIVFRLTSPLGTIVNLVNQDTYGGEQPGAGRQTVNFDDEAGSPVGGPNVISGTFRPVGSLADFDGQDAFGNWTLFIQDTVGADPLEYFASRIEIEVPEPTSLALAGLALGGLGFSSRRKASR